MGEKHKVENEEDEKKWEKLIQYYRVYCIRTYKDNPKNWQRQKDERRNIKKRNYTSREKREREQYYTKLARSKRRRGMGKTSPVLQNILRKNIQRQPQELAKTKR